MHCNARLQVGEICFIPIVMVQYSFLQKSAQPVRISGLDATIQPNVYCHTLIASHNGLNSPETFFWVYSM